MDENFNAAQFKANLQYLNFEAHFVANAHLAATRQYWGNVK